MNKLQNLMYNNGERLVPYVSHGENELIRHRSSYSFFYKVIMSDLEANMLPSKELTVADLGFGSGYGCALLSSLPSSRITGVDIGPECEIFAKKYYSRSNIDYVIRDLAEFIPEAGAFDYVVSRGVLEHVPDGLDLVGQIKFQHRIMIDVPYDEAAGNEHHVLTGIKEDVFSSIDNCEIFYEDLEGRIYDALKKPEKANMIMAVISSPHLPKVSDIFQFPIEPVYDTDLEITSGISALGKCHYYNDPDDLLTAVKNCIKATEVVLDVGCGIVPMNYFRPKMHLMVEPWKEYADILQYRHSSDKSIIIIRNGALEALSQLANNSVDSIFLLDVIEHLEKSIGQQVIIECERVAREQIVIFTPLGFMPQHIESNEADGWGLNGGSVQEHRSGWEPEDFGSEWTFYICESFHSVDFRCGRLDEPFGAFFALRNFEGKITESPKKMSDIRKPLPSEIEAQQMSVECDRLRALAEEYKALLQTRALPSEIEAQQMSVECDRLRALAEGYQSEYNKLFQTRGLRLIRRVRKILGYIGFR